MTHSVCSIYKTQKDKRRMEENFGFFLSVLPLLQIFTSGSLHVRSFAAVSWSKVRILFFKWLNFAFR